MLSMYKPTGTNVIIGCASSMCCFISVGIEYASVRTSSLPVSRCLKFQNSASKSSLALPTVVWKPSQSPMPTSVCASMPCEESQSRTALTLASCGAIKVFT
jgi:hypothetical protein